MAESNPSLHMLVSEAGIVGHRGSEIDSNFWHQHMAAAKIREEIGSETWQSYFKFSVIRNPFEKMVSGYYFFKSRKLPLRWRAKFHLQKLFNSEPNFTPEAKAIWATGKNDIEHFRNWLRLGVLEDREVFFIDGQPCMDHFIRYERLLADLEEVCTRLNVALEPERLSKYKSGIRNLTIPVADFYDEESIEIVQSQFDWEIKTFGYSMPNR